MLNFLKYLLTAMTFGLVLIGAVWLLLWRTEGIKLFSVQSGSMSPTLNKGDLVVDIKAYPQSIKPGDVVSYYDQRHPGKIITHRVISTDYGQGYLLTQGDNLAQADPAVPYASLTGRTIKVLPRLGYAFDQLHKPFGLIAFVYLPALFITLAEVWLVADEYRYRPYQLI